MMDEKNGNGEKKMGDPSIDVGGGRRIMLKLLHGFKFMLQNFQDVHDLRLAYLVGLIKLYENSNPIINCRFIAVEARKQ